MFSLPLSSGVLSVRELTKLSQPLSKTPLTPFSKAVYIMLQANLLSVRVWGKMNFWMKTYFEGVCFVQVQSSGVYFKYGLRRCNHFGGLREESLEAVPYSTFWESVTPLSHLPGLPYLKYTWTFHTRRRWRAGILSSPPTSPFLFIECANLPATNLLGLKIFTFVFTFSPYIS